MPSATVQAGEIKVYTFKTGLLSRVAHDLQLTLATWTLELDGKMLFGRFDPGSLRVDGAVKKGRLDHRALKDKDKRTIEQTIREEVLRTGQHRSISLQARMGGDPKAPVFTGSLAILGQSRPVTIEARETAGRLEVDTELVPSEWGIAPYEALMGAIKLQDRVRIRVRIEQWLDLVDTASGAAHDHSHDHGGAHSHDHSH